MRTKVCPRCGKEFTGASNQKYCSLTCGTAARVEKFRSKTEEPQPEAAPKKDFVMDLSRSHKLAVEYADKIGPILREHGYLNILSEGAFLEMCDLYARLQLINKALNETTFGLLQIDDKWSIKDGTETQCFKESALSDIKRKYSQRYMDYAKQFYLTPLAAKGKFTSVEKHEEEDEFA